MMYNVKPIDLLVLLKVKTEVVFECRGQIAMRGETSRIGQAALSDWN